MRILVINGPNLNMLGIREPEVYGKQNYNDLYNYITDYAYGQGIETEIKQSNHEGAIIDMIQDACFDLFDGVIINPGAYTHYSYAIRDALAILKCPVIEVHLSDIHSREEFRNKSVIEEVCLAQISGYGFESYKRAIDMLMNR